MQKRLILLSRLRKNILVDFRKLRGKILDLLNRNNFFITSFIPCLQFRLIEKHSIEITPKIR